MLLCGRIVPRFVPHPDSTKALLNVQRSYYAYSLHEPLPPEDRTTRRFMHAGATFDIRRLFCTTTWCLLLRSIAPTIDSEAWLGMFLWRLWRFLVRLYLCSLYHSRSLTAGLTLGLHYVTARSQGLLETLRSLAQMKQCEGVCATTYRRMAVSSYFPCRRYRCTPAVDRESNDHGARLGSCSSQFLEVEEISKIQD
ncbi:hypothetical protein BDR04DRAFT_468621 [Suillus decipiens]|nr:hypothetical protein BDR04DRAFT_468621 [Suillus decipiens]